MVPPCPHALNAAKIAGVSSMDELSEGITLHANASARHDTDSKVERTFRSFILLYRVILMQ